MINLMSRPILREKPPIVANLWRAGAPARFSGQKFGNKNAIKTET